jgi:hypothetical protein
LEARSGWEEAMGELISRKEDRDFLEKMLKEAVLVRWFWTWAGVDRCS